MLLEAITERRDRAMWFNGEPWHRDITSLHMDGTEHGAIRQRGGPFLVQGSFKAGAGLFIEAENPAAVLRQCTRDLRMLQRHAEDEECTMRDCLDMEEMAEAYGLGPCSTCGQFGGLGQIKCVAHVAGDGCDELVLHCPDCASTAYGLGVEAEGNQP
jgi:hypothetical protein